MGQYAAGPHGALSLYRQVGRQQIILISNHKIQVDTEKVNFSELKSCTSASAGLAFVKRLHPSLTGSWSGGDRYISGLGPRFVVAQEWTKASPFEAQLVHSDSGIASAEWQANKSNVLVLSYSGANFERVFLTDPSTGTLVEYGFRCSANSNNRTIQEATFATQITLWKQHG